ncbi:MAG TPA: hypothetical protein VF837_00980 [Patescibacteria group bacterium]
MDYGNKKRPMWQWIGIYLIIGLIVYGVVYYFMMNRGGYGQVTQTGTALATPTVSVTLSKTDVTTIKSNAAKGNYLTDLNGMTLYTFDNDKTGVSNCTGGCLTIWPAFLSSQNTVTQTNLGVITRPEGTFQYTWNGRPLYYYSKDLKVGDMNGDGFNNLWHIVKM